MKKLKAIIICGPTASGKSRIAVELAQKINGAVINADSMQIYDALPIMTASPNLEDKKNTPHFLYNFLDPLKQYSVANYLNDLKIALEECSVKNLVPIITGGTGMYINAAQQGVSKIPEIDISIRDELSELVKNEGIEHLYNLLKELDPLVAQKLEPADTQRIIRAHSVIKETGKSILEYQKTNSKSVLANYEVTTICLKPEREFLYDTCNKRLEWIVENGGLNEIKSMQNLHESPILKALGVRELKSYLEGEIPLEKAIEEAKAKTRQYAKRQVTWFNNQISWVHETINYKNIEEYMAIKVAILNMFL